MLTERRRLQMLVIRAIRPISRAINIQSLRDHAPPYSPYSGSTATTITPSILIRKVIVG
jgi:hypothetical protein